MHVCIVHISVVDLLTTEPSLFQSEARPFCTSISLQYHNVTSHKMKNIYIRTIVVYR